MSNTISQLHNYLKLADIPKSSINTILKRNDILLYSLLRDKLTHSELLELQIVLKDIYYKQDNPVLVDFSKYISLNHIEKKIASDILNLKTNSLLELATIVQLPPKELVYNIKNNL